MKLKGINITDFTTYKNHFTLEEVWENIDNGVFLKFQKTLEGREKKSQGKGEAQKETVAGEIVRVLEAYEGKWRLPELISDFFSNGQWDWGGMERRLEPLSSKSRMHDGECFYSRNIQEIRIFINRRGEAWDDKKAGLFYFFLLCLLQVNPQEKIREEEFAFIGGKLDLIKGERGYTAENGNRKGICMDIYPYGSNFLFLKGGKIFNEKLALVSPVSEKIICFAYTEEFGIIAFTEQGTPSACMELNTRYEIEEKRKEIGAENEKVIMAAARGNIYLLLLESGNILTNVLDSMEGWHDIRWVGAGLNSITAIMGNARSLLELGSDIRLHEFSGVKAAYTWSGDGKRKYGVLKENGDFIMDDGNREENVDAAYMDEGGYLYAAGSKIFLRRFGSEKKLCRAIEQGYTAIALCRRRSTVCVRAVSGMGETLLAKMEEYMFR